MTAARILTVRQPWAWAVIHGGKTVENRVRNIAGDYRGPVLIHAAKAMPTPDEWNGAGDVIASITGNRPLIVPPSQLGAIIGVVDLVDVHRPLWDYTCDGGHAVCSPWGEVDGWPYHLVFENPRALVEPIPYRGALGLRKTDFFITGNEWLGQYVTPGPKHGACTPYGCPPSCYSEPVGRLVATS